MRLMPSRSPLVGVVVPAYGVEQWLPDCLASLVGQTHRRWEAVVVDDGSPDRSGEIAEAWARKDRRIRVVHTENAGLGAARNAGLEHVRGDLVAFLDSDDVLPPTAYADLVGAMEESGSDMATGSIARWERGELVEPGWMQRLHRPRRTGIRIEEHPEVLGDVFAWNKLYRRSFWESAGLRWPEGLRYEDQPATTRAFLGGRFDVVPDVVYHWRIRDDGTSITQQRGRVDDLVDRVVTKRMSLASVREHGDSEVERVFVDRVLPGDMWRYFLLIPAASDEWWGLLRDGVRELWGERTLVHSALAPVHRLIGWLVAQDRRQDATLVVEYLESHPGPVPRVTDATGGLRIDVPGLDAASVDPAALRT